MKNQRKKTLLVVLAAIVLLAVVLSLPPVWSRVAYHSKEVYRTVKYWVQPPSEAVFVPSTNGNSFESASISAVISAATPTRQPTDEPTAIPTNAPTSQPKTGPTTIPSPTAPEATFTPTPTSVPLPSSVLLTGISCEPQFMNNCGPATLSMNLSYYDDWGKSQNAVASVLKPNGDDVNVMPYELVKFVNEHTALRALWRYGGDLQTIKTLLNAGFPVMIEKSFEPYTLRQEGWMGHYNLVVGYEDERQTLTVHDSYLLSYAPWGGEIPQEQWNSFIGFDFYYSDLEQAWRSFNFVFIVVYPPERENEVLNAIGQLADEERACNIAYERAMQETTSMEDMRDKFFAWFNAGTSLECLRDHDTAASAYDTAFGIYPQIKQASRPYRVLWYEIGPYSAYYHTGRYQDVINLATQTLDYMAEPMLEESYYWRALAYHKLGNTTQAIADLRASLECHPGYAPSVAMLKQLGKNP